MTFTSHLVTLSSEYYARAQDRLRCSDLINARLEIERCYATFVQALQLKQFPPSPADPLEPVTVAPGLSPAATPAGAASPSLSGTGGSLIDLPEEVPFQ